MTAVANAGPTDRTPASTLITSIERASTVIAPITVVTGLLVYVGWIRNNAYFSYFGVTQSMMSLSVQDYVVRSVDVTFGAVARLVIIALAYLVIDRLLQHLLRHPHNAGRVRLLAGIVAGLGILLTGAGLAFAVRLASGLSPLLAAVALGLGAVLIIRYGPLALGRQQGETAPRFEAVVMYAVLALALFWAATVYAQNLGTRAAEVVDEYPAELPVVTVFSTADLDLPGADRQVTRVVGPAKSPSYRYSGLFLLAYSNDRWFLITGRYAGDRRSTVMMLRDAENIRIEVANAR